MIRSSREFETVINFFNTTTYIVVLFFGIGLWPAEAYADDDISSYETTVRFIIDKSNGSRSLSGGKEYVNYVRKYFKNGTQRKCYLIFNRKKFDKNRKILLSNNISYINFSNIDIKSFRFRFGKHRSEILIELEDGEKIRAVESIYKGGKKLVRRYTPEFGELDITTKGNPNKIVRALKHLTNLCRR